MNCVSWIILKSSLKKKVGNTDNLKGMKNLITFFFLLISTVSFGQRSLLTDSTKAIRDFLTILNDTLENRTFVEGKGKKSFLISDKSLNRYLAREISYFISGTTDFSFYKAYTTFSNADKRLSFFYNHPFKDKNTDQLKGTVGGGIKGAIIDGITTIYNGSTFNNDVGLFFNYTNLSETGRIAFDKKSKSKVNERRKYYVDVISTAAELKWKKFRELNKDKNLLPSDLRENFLSSLLKESVNEFYANELSQSEEFINYSQSWWMGFNVYLPLGRTSYIFTNDLNKNTSPKTQNHEFKNLEIKGNLNYFRSREKLPFLLRAELTVANYNNILVYDNYSPEGLLLEKFTNIKKNQSYAYTDTSAVKGRIFKQTISKDGKKSDLYVGKYESFTKITLNPSLLFPFRNSNYLKGIRFFGNIDLQKEWKNSNAGFAIPLSFQGKEDKKVNLELATTIKDLSNSFGTYSKLSDRLNVGINLGLPLSNFFFD